MLHITEVTYIVVVIPDGRLSPLPLPVREGSSYSNIISFIHFFILFLQITPLKAPSGSPQGEGLGESL